MGKLLVRRRIPGARATVLGVPGKQVCDARRHLLRPVRRFMAQGKRMIDFH